MRPKNHFVVPALVLVAGGVLAGERAFPRVPTSQDSAGAVVMRYGLAAGGEALEAIDSETRRGTLVRGATGRVPLEVASRAPGRWRWAQTLAWGDQLAYGFDGSHGWVQDGEGVGAMSSRQALDFHLLFDITAPLRMKEIFPDLTLKGLERIGQRDATVLVGRSPDGQVTELVFDKETGLLVRAGKILLEDYRDVGDVTRPFRLRLGDMLVAEFSEIQLDLAVDESIFQRPTSALPPGDPVIFRRYEEVEVSAKALDACVGAYQLAPGVVFDVSREGDHLMFQAPGSPKLQLFPVSDRSFVLRFNYLEFHFLADESGEVRQLALGAHGSRVAERIR